MRFRYYLRLAVFFLSLTLVGCQRSTVDGAGQNPATHMTNASSHGVTRHTYQGAGTLE